MRNILWCGWFFLFVFFYEIEFLLLAVCQMLRSYAKESIEIHLTVDGCWVLVSPFVGAAIKYWKHVGLDLWLHCLIGFQ